jgi:NAD(P)-dependent dehydrogenase (short-subunit alcohol dehydrogenase family)
MSNCTKLKLYPIGCIKEDRTVRGLVHCCWPMDFRKRTYVKGVAHYRCVSWSRPCVRREAAVASFGGLDVLVNNAGYGYVRPVEDTSLADFRAQIETNLFGVIIMTKAVIPYFRERRAGHIIQVTSIAGRIGPAGRAPYAAAKFGVEGFSESLSRELQPLGVRVTIIEPGGFRTDFAGSSTELSEGRSEYDSTVGASVRFQRSYNGKQPGDPAKAAAVLLHIASLSEPPLRLLLGSDCYAAAEKSALEKLESDRRWKDLSLSTDYSSDETHV